MNDDPAAQPQTPAPTPRGERSAQRFGRAETRERIVAAADQVMRELGLANATTKRIAHAAGCSEAALYKHFSDKGELFLQVLRSRFPPFVDVLAALPERAGQGSVSGNLTDLACKAVPFYRYGAAALGSLFAEPELLHRHREDLGRSGAGPMNVNRLVAAYLAEERRLGRIAPGVVPDAAAALLMGACFQRAFLEEFLADEELYPPLERFAAEVVAGLALGGAEVRE